MARSFRSMKEAIENGRGVERPFCCPIHDDQSASASVNVVKWVWFCYVCHKGGPTQEGTHDRKYIPLMSEGPIPVLGPLAVDYTNAISGYGSYWAYRVGKDVATRYQTGVDPVTGMPTIPIHNALGTEVHGFLTRRTEFGVEGPKYLYPAGVPVSRLLFGHHLVESAPEVLVLVEGASDAMSMHRWPAPSGMAVVAVYGAGLHVPQALLVKGLSPHHVVCAMDADNAGREATIRSLRKMAEVGVGAIGYDWSEMGANDPGEITEDPWQKIRSAVSMTRC